MNKTKIWEILVPTISNNKPFRTRHHKEWDSRVRKISGGLTVFKPAKGSWVSPTNQLFVERMIPVRIACTQKQIDKIADITAKHYNQEAIFYYLISDKIVMFYYNLIAN